MAITLEQRVAALEQQILRMQQRDLGVPAGRAWLDDLYGKFANDAIFDEAMKLGRKYRQSGRPHVRKGELKG